MKRKTHIRQTVAVSAVLLAVLFLMPLAVIVPFQVGLHTEAEDGEAKDIPLTGGARDVETALRVLHGEQVEEMDLAGYLVGVVRAEMPASFEPEALKAQAAAARTYTLYKMNSGGNHGDRADICTDPACCQAYLDEETARKNWGELADTYEEKVERAVTDTDGQVILYEDAPILAVFHSSSAGLTRTAGTVWSGDLPYLQAVDSPEEGAGIPNYYSRVEVSAGEFKEAVLTAHPEAELSGSMETWLTNAEVDAAGSVGYVDVGGVRLRGSELRNLLGLRSACFTWEAQEGMLVFFVTGYGHGVGLSQYGANQMAKDGADWREILTHYYTGVRIGAYRFTNERQP